MSFLLRFWKRLAKVELTLALLLSIIVVIIGTLAIHWLEPNTFPTIFESLWWTMTTLTTVGYGDYFPTSTAGRLLGMFLFIFGIGILGLLIGKIVDVLYTFRRLKREGKVLYTEKNHYVYIGWSKKTEQTIFEIFAHEPKAEIVLIDTLRESPVTHEQVHYINGEPSEEQTLLKANITHSKRVAIFADDSITQPLLADGKTLLIASAVESLASKHDVNIHTIVEINEEKHINAFNHIKVDDFIMSNDGISLLMAKATLHPGTTLIFRQLLSKKFGNNIHELEPSSSWKTYKDAATSLMNTGAALIAVNDEMDFTGAEDKLLSTNDILYIVCNDETFERIHRKA
ncbi:ion channel [Bacillus spongiae]|uniref:Ion channel n=1 Tax=Bacillus spongiae TaxID=2683610 RepID=A0ABU8HG69_9BACI